jgi:hypothetical protein
MSARVARSMGREVIEKRPRRRPHCKAMSSALKVTARMAARKRCRSYQRVDRA